MPVKSTYLTFKPSTSPDVVGYILYMEESPNPIDVNTSESWDIGNPPVEGVDGKVHYDLTQLDGMTTKDGTYNFGVAAVDDVGNSSSLLLIKDVALDFVAPNPPTEGAVVRDL